MSSTSVPLPGFYFKLTVFQNGSELGELLCYDVKGLKFDLVLDTGEETPPNFVTDIKFGDLVITKPVTATLTSLETKFYNYMIKSIEDTTASYFDLLLMALNEQGSPVRSWQFSDAFPISMSTDGFDAKSSGMLTETLTFRYNEYTVIVN
ncbi:MAG: phage tail protein [Bacteroidota bacterium]